MQRAGERSDTIARRREAPIARETREVAALGGEIAGQQLDPTPDCVEPGGGRFARGICLLSMIVDNGDAGYIVSCQHTKTMEKTMSDSASVLADLARDVGAALTAFSEAIRPSASTDASPEGELEGLGLGRRQQEIAELPGLNTNDGMSATQVAREIGYDPANTHTALKSLTDRDVLEGIRTATGEPARWRLAPRYRGVSDPYLRLAGLVRSGEWTTYGDISIAARGDTLGARAVGRAAATLPHFPNPHRVLWSGGRVPSAWKSHESATPDPQECVRRLELEGVGFDDRGQASRAHYVSWDTLVERSEREG